MKLDVSEIKKNTIVEIDGQLFKVVDFAFMQMQQRQNMMHVLLAAGFVFLISCGLVYLSILDQRYRCRVCARRLRMPVTSGSWGQLLQLGRPHLEYICPYGHGTLKVAELQISGLEPAEWTENGDMWEELAAADKEEK